MAMFHTHIHCSTIAGIAGGIAAYTVFGVPLTTSAVGGGLCCIGGILPDIDSGPGIPLREITTFLASVVPTMLISRLLANHFSQESLILTGAIIYVAIRFGLSHFLRHYTIHRGMFHSFPTAAIFGEMTYLLFYGESMFVRTFMVCSVCTGVFIHLLLDEIYSVEWDGKPRLKKSFGTAMKFVGNGWWPNITCYGKLAVLTYFVLNDPSVIQQLYAGQGSQIAGNLGESVKDRFESAVAKTRANLSGQAAPTAMVPAGSASGYGANNGYAPANGYAPISGPPSNAYVPVNSNTAPQGTAWPSAQAAAPYAPAAQGTQPAPANWSGPAAGPQSASYPANASPASNAGMAPSNAAPSRPAAAGRFWQ